MWDSKLPAKVRDVHLVKVIIKTIALMVITLPLIIATPGFAAGGSFAGHGRGLMPLLAALNVPDGGNSQHARHQDRGPKEDKDKKEIHGAEMSSTALLLAGLLAGAGYILLVRRRRGLKRS